MPCQLLTDNRKGGEIRWTLLYHFLSPLQQVLQQILSMIASVIGWTDERSKRRQWSAKWPPWSGNSEGVDFCESRWTYWDYIISNCIISHKNIIVKHLKNIPKNRAIIKILSNLYKTVTAILLNIQTKTLLTKSVNHAIITLTEMVNRKEMQIEREIFHIIKGASGYYYKCRTSRLCEIRLQKGVHRRNSVPGGHF